MWVKVDIDFLTHPKVMAAAAQFRRAGYQRVISVWLEALCHASRTASDGFVSVAAARQFKTDVEPVLVLDVMSGPTVGLLVKFATGYQIHEYTHYQITAAETKTWRDRLWKSRTKSGEFSTGIGNANELPMNCQLKTPPKNGQIRKNIPGFEFSTGCIPAIDLDLEVQDQDQALSRQLLTTKVVRRHLLRAAHAELDINPEAPDSVLGEAVKDAAAQLRVAYDIGIVGTIVRAARGARR